MRGWGRREHTRSSYIGRSGKHSPPEVARRACGAAPAAHKFRKLPALPRACAC